MQVFWAEYITISKVTGYSPFYLAHRVEPTLPFNLAEATYLLPPLDIEMSTSELLVARARMLEKCKKDLVAMSERVYSMR